MACPPRGYKGIGPVGSCRVLFELREVGLTRGGRVVLDGVSAGIPAGATAIVGPSGSGKSTLLRLLNRLADPDRGEIAYRGEPLARATTRSRCGARSRWSRSCRRCWRARSSRTSRYAAGLAGEELDAPRCLRLAGLDPEFAGRDVAKLSVGEQQRAMLARALAQQPEVLLLDEPTSALDHAARDAIEATLAELRRELEISIVLVTHDPEQARRLSDWVVRLEAGRVVGCGASPRCWRETVHGRRAVPGPSAALRPRSTSPSARSPPRSPWSPWRRRSPSGGRPTSSATSASPPSARSIQLTAIGYAIKLIFEADTLWLVFVLLAVMVLFGALTAPQPRRQGPARLLAAADRPGARRRQHPRPRRRPRHLRSRRRATWSRSAAW